MQNLQDSILSIQHKATSNRPYVFPEYSLNRAQHIATGRNITVTRLPQSDSYSVTVNAIAIDMAPLMATAGMISKTAFATTQYGNVIHGYLFRLLYGVEHRHLTYYIGGVLGTQLVESAPCMICGLVLPLDNLTVDHQSPQTGGEYEAVARTFRAFGLTKEGPKGPKGQMIRAHLTAQNPGAVMPTQAPPKPGRQGNAGGSLDDRYTLNDNGAILYSFAFDAGHIEQLKQKCMHGLMNLRPACGNCNSKRGNPLKFPNAMQL